jgi:hypothetical protein
MMEKRYGLIIIGEKPKRYKSFKNRQKAIRKIEEMKKYITFTIGG